MSPSLSREEEEEEEEGRLGSFRVRIFCGAELLEGFLKEGGANSRTW